MLIRTLAAVAALAFVANGTLSAQQEADMNIGNVVILEMTGKLATEYAKQTDSINNDKIPDGLQISTTATIVQKLNDGRIRIEHTSHVARDGKPARLVTLTATVDSTNLTPVTTPKGTPVYASPGDHKNGAEPKRTTKETKAARLQLSELKGVKLCTWRLEQEVGE